MRSPAPVLFDPVLGHAVVERGVVPFRPGVIAAEVEVARLAVGGGAVGQVTGQVRRLAGRNVLAQPHRVVLLAALAAEHQGQQHLVPVVRHEPLTVDGQVAVGLGLQGGVDRVAAADELV
jgi:hypothetical protein